MDHKLLELLPENFGVVCGEESVLVLINGAYDADPNFLPVNNNVAHGSSSLETNKADSHYYSKRLAYLLQGDTTAVTHYGPEGHVAENRLCLFDNIFDDVVLFRHGLDK